MALEACRICVFKVTVAWAKNVWILDGDDVSTMAKAAVTVRFPGQEADSLFQSAGVSPVDQSPDIANRIENGIAEKPDGTSPGKGSKALKGKKEQEEGVIPRPATFVFRAVADFVRESNWLLWNNLVNDPLVITLLWISPTSQIGAVVGSVSLGLSDLLLREGFLECECVIDPSNPTENVETKSCVVGGKKDATQKGPIKGKKGNSVDEVVPVLREGAMLKVQISTDIPVLSDIDRREGILLEFGEFCVKPVPPHTLATSTASNPSTYGLSFQIPGFCGPWWNSISSVKQEMKDSLAVARIYDGRLVFTCVESTTASQTSIEASPEDNLARVDPEPGFSTSLIAGSNPGAVEPRTGAMITWDSSIKRFLPSEAAKELKDSIWRKSNWHGEVAGYPKTEQSGFDPAYVRDHQSLCLDLSSLMEEGVCEAIISSPLEDFRSSKPELLRVSAKVDNDPKRTSGNTMKEHNGTDNQWRSCLSQLIIHIKTSRPFEPVWVAPPEPELKLVDVLTVRPKLAKFTDKLEIAMDEFREFIKVGAQSIFLLQQKILSDDKSQLTNSIHVWSNRAEHKEELRKMLSNEVHKTGTWQNLKEEMKGRVLKIIYEKLKLESEVGEREKLYFYNSLYTQLMESVQDSIKELDFMRKESFLKFSEGVDTRVSKRIHTLEHLRQLADEYEADGDYQCANKCYEQRIWEDVTNPDPWFEYGMFCMRGKQKDHGKAEECFRESINLCQEHVLSLLALACLLWHRSLHLQSDTLLQKVIELHPQEEFLPWILLGQLHASQGQNEHTSRCFRKAEVLHAEWKATKTSRASPHELNSSLLKHPFSLSHLILQYYISNSPYVDTALLLLDLHLPLEAQKILSIDHAIFLCDIEYKLCTARVCELLGDTKRAEELIKEALIPCKSHKTAWTLLGHIYYSSLSIENSIHAYEKMQQYSGEKPGYLHGCLELGKCYLSHARFDQAKKIFLSICSLAPNSSSWLGAGMAYYKEGDMQKAEAALVEGNVLDPWNFKIWAYLTLVCLSTNRMDEAEFSFQQSLKSNIFPPLLLDVAAAFSEKRNFSFFRCQAGRNCSTKSL